jgi:hypothetical protein
VLLPLQLLLASHLLLASQLAAPPLAAPCPANPLPEPAPPPDLTAVASDQAPAGVQWADVDRVYEPDPELSLDWALFQLLPSPELGLGRGGASFGLRWQITPLSYSFATDARLDRWRWLLVEPIVRQSGSVELFVSPEYLAGRLGGRVGLRSYFGLIGRGDNLSVSIGSSYFRFGNVGGVSYEAGAYILFGALGLQLSYSPGFERASWLTTLRLRYF